MDNYLEIVHRVHELLYSESNNGRWQKLYFQDAKMLSDKSEIPLRVFKGRKFHPLKMYTNFTTMNYCKHFSNKKESFDQRARVQLRYHGVYVANADWESDKPIEIFPVKLQNTPDWDKMKFNWNSAVGTSFRAFVKDHTHDYFIDPNNKKNRLCESYYESQIIDHLTSSISRKQPKGIRAIDLGGCRFQMPTVICASDLWHGGLDSLAYRDTGKRGGGIDILCRSKSGPFGNTLTVIEVKDRAKPNNRETFDKVMGQAVAYAAFMRELLRSPGANADLWWKIFGFNNKCGIPQKLIIKAVVAMPAQDVSDNDKANAFVTRKIKINIDGHFDEIHLHHLLYAIDDSGENIKEFYFSNEDEL